LAFERDISSLFACAIAPPLGHKPHEVLDFGEPVVRQGSDRSQDSLACNRCDRLRLHLYGLTSLASWV